MRVPRAAATIRDSPDSTILEAVFDDAGRLVTSNAPTGTSIRAVNRRRSLATLAESLRVGRPLAAGAFRLNARGGGYLAELTRIATPAGPYTAATLLPLHSTQESSSCARGTSRRVLPLVLILAGVGGYFFAGRALVPTRTYGYRPRIGPDNLHERLPIPAETEVAALATVVNGLLERVDASFSQQRRFMADASHELRTPVAVLGIEADVTLGKPHRTEAEYRESLHVIRDAGTRLGRVVDDLFLLSRVDAGEPIVMPSEMCLADVVRDATRAVRRLADQRGIVVACEIEPTSRDSEDASADAPFVGDPALLGRLVLNLLQNAVSYSGPGASVTIVLRRSREGYRITVSDTGPGIPVEDQPHLFELLLSRGTRRARGRSIPPKWARLFDRAMDQKGIATLVLSLISPEGTVFDVTL